MIWRQVARLYNGPLETGKLTTVFLQIYWTTINWNNGFPRTATHIHINAMNGICNANCWNPMLLIEIHGFLQITHAFWCKHYVPPEWIEQRLIEISTLGAEFQLKSEKCTQQLIEQRLIETTIPARTRNDPKCGDRKLKGRAIKFDCN